MQSLDWVARARGLSLRWLQVRRSHCLRLDGARRQAKRLGKQRGRLEALQVGEEC